MKTSNKGIDLIKKYEGLRLKAYKCPAGVWTIGYGHTGADVAEGLEITEERADELLLSDIAQFENHVNSVVESTIKQNQFDALVSFAFNLGGLSLKNSTLLKRVNANPIDPAISDELKRWVNEKGKPLAGLVKRRAEEAELYFSTT
jgi:Phage-related lysozyme (muraminidase)